MPLKLNFRWSATNDDPPFGLVHILSEDGELIQRAPLSRTVDLDPGRYRLRVLVAGHEPFASDVMELTEPSTIVNLNTILDSPTSSTVLAVATSSESPRLQHMWRVETWAGNLFTGDCHLVDSLGLWDGRFAVGLRWLQSHQALFVRVVDEDAAEDMLMAVPASNEGSASLFVAPHAPSGLIDDRSLMKIKPDNPAAGMLIDLRKAGAVSDAIKLAPELAQGLIESAQKRKDPLAAVIGCYFLLRVVDRDDDPRKLWADVVKAIGRLEAYESWLPDSAVLSGDLAAIEERYETAATCLCKLNDLGPPLVTSGLTRAIDLARLVSEHLPKGESLRNRLNEVQGRLVTVAVAADLSQPFLTMRKFRPTEKRGA